MQDARTMMGHMQTATNAANSLHRTLGMGSTEQSGNKGAGAGAGTETSSGAGGGMPQLGNLFANGMPTLRKAGERASGECPQLRGLNLRNC